MKTTLLGSAIEVRWVLQPVDKDRESEWIDYDDYNIELCVTDPRGITRIGNFGSSNIVNPTVDTYGYVSCFITPEFIGVYKVDLHSKRGVSVLNLKSRQMFKGVENDSFTSVTIPSFFVGDMPNV